MVGAPLGHDVTIECVIEAFPKAITYWQKIKDGKEKIILNGYNEEFSFNELKLNFIIGRPEQRVEEDRIGYKTSSRLRISNFSSEDAGTYHCVSSNSLGSAQEAIRIYGELIFYVKRGIFQ